jgi:hypothetical protein
VRALLLFLFACRTVEPQIPSDGSAADTPFDSGDKSAACASTFGNELTNAFGRLDGTVLALVEPGNSRCAMPNGTHVVLQVTTNGAAYRMVVNVVSTSPDPHVWLGETTAPLAAGPWSEGWHPGVQLDYVTTLGVTKSSFTESNLSQAVARLDEALVIGAHVSVFATSSGGASAHLVHRNVTNGDGAIVIDPESASPRYLLSAFPEQQF